MILIASLVKNSEKKLAIFAEKNNFEKKKKKYFCFQILEDFL